MLHALNTLLAPAVMQRVLLLLNHVMAAEPVAMQKMAAHAGRTIEVFLREWPTLLPSPPQLKVRVTPPGLFEWCGKGAEPTEPASTADLQLRLDASNPALMVAKALAGEQPAVEIQGDAALAADVGWLLDNVRWDVEADLERVVGPTVAHQLAGLGAALKRALAAALRRGGDIASRLRPAGAGRSGA